MLLSKEQLVRLKATELVAEMLCGNESANVYFLKFVDTVHRYIMEGK
jgi:hypothetical protein